MLSLSFQVCEIEPGIFRDCDSYVRSLPGWVEILSLTAHAEGETRVDQHDNSGNFVPDLIKQMQTQDLSKGTQAKQGQSQVAHTTKNRCSTCQAAFEDASQYREHFKTEWHKHNLRRKTRQLPPLSSEECLADMDSHEYKGDLSNYSF